MMNLGSQNSIPLTHILPGIDLPPVSENPLNSTRIYVPANPLIHSELIDPSVDDVPLFDPNLEFELEIEALRPPETVIQELRKIYGGRAIQVVEQIDRKGNTVIEVRIVHLREELVGPHHINSPENNSMQNIALIDRRCHTKVLHRLPPNVFEEVNEIIEEKHLWILGKAKIKAERRERRNEYRPDGNAYGHYKGLNFDLEQ